MRPPVNTSRWFLVDDDGRITALSADRRGQAEVMARRYGYRRIVFCAVTPDRLAVIQVAASPLPSGQASEQAGPARTPTRGPATDH